MRARYKPLSAVALSLAIAGIGAGTSALPGVSAIAGHSAYVELVLWEEEADDELTTMPGLAACEATGPLAGAFSSVKGLFGQGSRGPDTACLSQRGNEYVWVSHRGTADPALSPELLRTGRVVSAVDRNGISWDAAEFTYREPQENGRWSYTWVVHVGDVMPLPSDGSPYNFVAVADTARFDARVLPSDGAASLRVQLGPAPLMHVVR